MFSRLSAIPVALLSCLMLTSLAIAFYPPGQGFNNSNQSNNNPNQNQYFRGGLANGLQGTPGQASQSGLQGGNLRSCQAREDAIKQRSTHLTQLATNMESKFDSITSRIEDYYTSKVVPSGKTVPNYSTLVSDIQTNKTAVQTALTSASNDAANFTCLSGNPKGQLTQFRTDMQAVIQALKSYRTSIKNLIVAVHSVVGDTNSSENQASNSAQGENNK